MDGFVCCRHDIVQYFSGQIRNRSLTILNFPNLSDVIQGHYNFSSVFGASNDFMVACFINNAYQLSRLALISTQVLKLLTFSKNKIKSNGGGKCLMTLVK